ncbi:hypothetical protein ACH4SP_00770 [Streptomyces sp. NPDC021093]|uniref:hypothetical protein n=1 Tax=Streptomyces sp. NPDC021093 TaxID=3365112 RepID=UPI003798BE45
MDISAADEARRWLAEDGITQVGPDEWTDGETPDGRLDSGQVAHEQAGLVFSDERLDVAGQVRLAFGLLDVLDQYWVTVEIRFADRGAAGPLPAEPLWDCYRQRLEAPRVSEAVTYSLWVDWFEDGKTSTAAFEEVIGRDAGRLTADAPATLLRRAGRVLECSGPVPWEAKLPVFRAATRVPSLHLPLFKGLLTGYHDVYGQLLPDAALALLGELDLPADTEHAAELRTVLAAGHANHYRSPGAWEEAVRAPTRP